MYRYLTFIVWMYLLLSRRYSTRNSLITSLQIIFLFANTPVQWVDIERQYDCRYWFTNWEVFTEFRFCGVARQTVRIEGHAHVLIFVIVKVNVPLFKSVRPKIADLSFPVVVYSGYCQFYICFDLNPFVTSTQTIFNLRQVASFYFS